MKSSNRVYHQPLSWFLSSLLLSIFLLFPPCNAEATVAHCEEEKDLELDGCTLPDLPDSALKSICDRIGFDVETQIFNYLFLNEEENEGEGSSVNADGEVEVTKREYTHEDYVKAAEECLIFEIEALEYLEDEAELAAPLIAETLEQDPALMDKVIEKLSKDAPEEWNQMKSFINADGEHESVENTESSIESDGEWTQKLKERSDVVGYFVAMILKGKPELLEEFDELSEVHDFITVETVFFEMKNWYWWW